MMQRRFALALVAAALFCQVEAHAAVTIVSVTGAASASGQDIRIDGNSLAAVHWTVASTYANVNISAPLYCTPCGKGDSSFADVYLTTRIGPNATNAQQVAFARVKVTDSRGFVTLFSGLTLSPADYYLVIYSPYLSQSGPLNPGTVTGAAVAWSGTADADAVVTTAPGNSREQMLIYSTNSPAPLINTQYPPSSFFFTSPTTPNYDLNGAYNLQYAVIATPSVLVPHVVSGGGWKTSFALANLDSSPITYSLLFRDDSGKSLQLPVSSGSGAIEGTINPGAVYFVEAGDGSPTLQQGWAEVVASGRIGVSAVLRQVISGSTYAEAGLSGKNPSNSAAFLFDNTQGFVTTLAMVNTSSTNAMTVLLSAQYGDGTQKQLPVTIPPRGHIAFSMKLLVPSSSDQRGILQLVASSPDLVATALRFDRGGSFIVLPSY